MVRFAIKDEGSVVDDGDIVAGDALAEHSGEEAGVAIDGVAVGCIEDVADDGAGDLRGEDDGGLLGFGLARAEALQGAASGLLTDGDGVLQQAGGAGGGVPVVALHAAVGFVGDGLGGEATVAAAKLTGEAARVHEDLVRGCGVEVATAGVLDAGVEGEGCGLDGAGDLDAVGGRLLVDVVEVEVLGSGVVLAEVGGFGQAGEGVLAGDAGESDGSGYQALDALGRKIRGGGAGGAKADEDTQADGAGAGLLERLDLAEADEGGELIALVDDGFGVCGTGAEGAGEDV